MPELTKTKKIIHTRRRELTETEIAAYVIAGVKRDHKELKDYELTCGFNIEPLVLTAVVEGERVS
jgi:hypothetical protein